MTPSSVLAFMMITLSPLALLVLMQHHLLQFVVPHINMWQACHAGLCFTFILSWYFLLIHQQ